jgi:predicted DNA-binding transcriptional regulator AlpA
MKSTKKSQKKTPKRAPTGPQRVLRTAGAAHFIGVSEPYLEKRRVAGGGPRFLRLGTRAVGYDINDLIEWIELQKVRSTSEAVS